MTKTAYFLHSPTEANATLQVSVNGARTYGREQENKQANGLTSQVLVLEGVASGCAA